MGTSEEDARKAELVTLVNSSEKDWRFWVATQLLDLRSQQQNIATNGCARACADKPPPSSWVIPSVAGGGMGLFLAAMWKVVEAKLFGGGSVGP